MIPITFLRENSAVEQVSAKQNGERRVMISEIMRMDCGSKKRVRVRKYIQSLSLKRRSSIRIVRGIVINTPCSRI